MRFYIQDPLYSDSILLHEILLSSCKEAVYGGGIYSFVTVDGINLLFGDKVFSEFVKRGKYKLIVGMDDVTSIEVLNKLREMRIFFGDHFEVYAFLQPNKSVIDHSRYTWFKTSTGGILIDGFDELTQKKLRVNKEDVRVSILDERAMRDIENRWNSWIEANKDFLIEIEDAEVVKKGKENAIKSIKHTPVRKRKFQNKDSEPTERQAEFQAEAEYTVYEEDDAWLFTFQNKILFAEIPRSNNRWKQANFDRDTFENFFGAKCGQNNEYRILLRSVNKAGNMGQIEIRPAVSVTSRNYRFELNMASGLKYPEQGRPIAVFVKISDRTFLYELFLPGNDYYEEVLWFINEKSRIHRVDKRLRRVITSVKDSFDKCPNLALWNNLVDDGDLYDGR